MVKTIVRQQLYAVDVQLRGSWGEKASED